MFDENTFDACLVGVPFFAVFFFPFHSCFNDPLNLFAIQAVRINFLKGMFAEQDLNNESPRYTEIYLYK